VVLGQVDPQTPKHEPDKSTTYHTSKHHTSQNPQEVYAQSTIQHHRDAIHILKKDLSLDDPNTLTFHRDKLKEAQDALDKTRKLEKQNELLSTVTQDVAHDVGPADHLHKSMWDYNKNTKITTPPPPCLGRHVLMLLQTNVSGSQDPLPSTPSIGTAFDSPWAITFSNTPSHPTMRKVHNTLPNSFPE